ncbi:MAG: DUF2298 domain-containing protein [Mobilitalea sp.]
MKKIIYAVLAVLIFIFGKFLLKGDYTAFLQWWGTILILGIVFLPLTMFLFSSFCDKGYLFSKSIAVAVTGYLMWLFSSLHLMKFNTISCILSVLLCLIGNGLLMYWLIKKNDQNNKNTKSWFRINSKLINSFLAEELLFFALFLIFTYIRGFKPEAYGTEKFMDYGFMTSMMRSDYMPPQDFWFSGTNLNYYYVGQYLATFLTKLSSVKVELGYNLMLMMVGTFAFVLPYSLVKNVVKQHWDKIGKMTRVIPMISGLLAGTAVLLAGNMHYPTYQWFEGWVRKFFGMEAAEDKYWFPDATRFIGYHPDTTDKTIHEFPAYSFVLGDLHAHVINIMFVLTVLGILFAWMCKRNKNGDTPIPLLPEVFQPSILMIGFFIGLFHMTNYWDFPIYFIVSGAVILFSNMLVYNFKGKRVIVVTGLQGILVILISIIISAPFTWKFDQISSIPRLSLAHTPLNQLIILWGLPIGMVIAFLCYMISDFIKDRRANLSEEQTVKISFLTGFMRHLTVSDLFVITIGLCSIGLILMPEVIYIEDIYSGDYKRANTMFKLTYQAFIMFGISMGYIFLRLLIMGRTRRQRNAAIIGLILFALSVCYIQNAVNSWYGNVFKTSGYKGLDATAFMETTMPEDEKAINWLLENVSGMPVVLEAPGDSYTDYQRVSVITGLPTILGWHTHEWLWKSDVTLLDERTIDIEQIYTSTDPDIVKQLLAKYKVKYIYVGKLEQEKYTNLNHELLKSLGAVVYHSAEENSLEFETYIVQVY